MAKESAIEQPPLRKRESLFSFDHPFGREAAEVGALCCKTLGLFSIFCGAFLTFTGCFSLNPPEIASGFTAVVSGFATAGAGDMMSERLEKYLAGASPGANAASKMANAQPVGAQLSPGAQTEPAFILLEPELLTYAAPVMSARSSRRGLAVPAPDAGPQRPEAGSGRPKVMIPSA